MKLHLVPEAKIQTTGGTKRILLLTFVRHSLLFITQHEQLIRLTKTTFYKSFSQTKQQKHLENVFFRVQLQNPFFFI
jgi:hypothetical protein